MAGYKKGEAPVVTDKEALTKLRKEYKDLQKEYKDLNEEHEKLLDFTSKREVEHLNVLIENHNKNKQIKVLEEDRDTLLGVGTIVGSFAGFIGGAVWYAINVSKGK